MTSEDPTVWQWIADKVWLVLGVLIGIVWKQNEDKIGAIKGSLKEAQERTDAELAVQRSHIAKIFDKMEAHSQRAEDRHHELLTAIHTGLAGKQDKQ